MLPGVRGRVPFSGVFGNNLGVFVAQVLGKVCVCGGGGGLGKSERFFFVCTVSYHSISELSWNGVFAWFANQPYLDSFLAARKHPISCQFFGEARHIWGCRCATQIYPIHSFIGEALLHYI